MKLLKLRIGKIKYFWLLVFTFLLLTKCITPYDPEIKKYEDLLVVDGAVSNIPGEVYVKLSRTSSYNSRIINSVNAAKVTLLDDLDNRIDFINSADGKYTPNDPDYAGEIGRSYRIHIETADGTICESLPEEIQEPIQLDAVKYEFVEGANDKEKGLDIMVDVLNVKNLNTFLYWEYSETWEFEVPFSSMSLPDAKVCYKTVKPPVFLIASTQNLVQKQILNYPLYFIDNTSNRLYKKYSANITQHIISEQTYIYYHDLKEINENRGSLFDTSPIALIGNLRNLSNSDQPVLGNFQVSGVVTKRIFIQNKDIANKLLVPSGFDNCELVFAGMLSDAFLLDSLVKAGWYVAESNFNEAVNDTIVSLTNSKGCIDCRTNGSNIKPDFWDNE